MDNFINGTCETFQSDAYLSGQFECDCYGKTTPGMPEIQLDLKVDVEDQRFYFSSSDYFIYPTIYKQTQAKESIYGLHSLVNNKSLELPIDTFIFG